MCAALRYPRWIALSIFLATLGASSACFGQGSGYHSYGGRYYSPYGPTLSPYLDYFRRDTGVLDPYNAFIRPRRQLQNQLADAAQQAQVETTKLQQQVQGVKEAQAHPTGVGAGYLNYSHYYKLPAGGNQPRRK
jgi:hypothetical protein